MNTPPEYETQIFKERTEKDVRYDIMDAWENSFKSYETLIHLNEQE